MHCAIQNNTKGKQLHYGYIVNEVCEGFHGECVHMLIAYTQYMFACGKYYTTESVRVTLHCCVNTE